MFFGNLPWAIIALVCVVIGYRQHAYETEALTEKAEKAWQDAREAAAATAVEKARTQRSLQDIRDAADAVLYHDGDIYETMSLINAVLTDAGFPPADEDDDDGDDTAIAFAA